MKQYPLINKSGSQLGKVILTDKQDFFATTEYGNYSFHWTVSENIQTFILHTTEDVLAKKLFNGLPYQNQTKEMREYCQTFAEETLPALKEFIRAELSKTSVGRSCVMGRVKAVMESQFNNGLWTAVQFLVCSHNETELAKQLILESGLTKQNCLASQTESEFESETMLSFIESVFPSVDEMKSVRIP